MNKLIYLMPMVLILLSGTVLAQTPPSPPVSIWVKVVTNTVLSGIQVDIQNTNTGTSNTYYTNEFGEVATDVNSFPNSRDTDIFRITIVECSANSACVQSVALGNEIFLQFDLRDIYNPPVPPVDTTPYEKCDSCCPSVPSCENQGYILPESCVTEEKTIWDFTLELVITVVVAAAAGAGVGIKVTRYGTKLHEHRNIRGYHSPDVLHKNQPHKKGEIAPKYATTKGSDGYYKYVGG